MRFYDRRKYFSTLNRRPAKSLFCKDLETHIKKLAKNNMLLFYNKSNRKGLKFRENTLSYSIDAPNGTDRTHRKAKRWEWL